MTLREPESHPHRAGIVLAALYGARIEERHAFLPTRAYVEIGTFYVDFTGLDNVRQLSLAIVGADHPNKRGPTRRFELAICKLCEPLELRPEPENKFDEYAVAVYSCRGVQLGYVTAERAPWIGRMLSNGREVTAVFQGTAKFGGWARVAFDGEVPALPAKEQAEPGDAGGHADQESGFYPDPIYGD